MTPSALQHIQVDTGPDPRTAILWLHGLGADGHDFEPLVPMLRIPADTPARFVFPHAPVRPVTINGGVRMRAWYDLRALWPEVVEAGEDLRESVEAIHALGGALRDQCPRLILGGFSQGGAVALATTLCTDLHPDAVFALSGYLPDLDGAGLAILPGPRTGRIFQAHGLADPIIPVDAGRAAVQSLRRLGLEVEHHEYPMGHQVCEAEVEDFRAWLVSSLAGS
jgi:phospholipase/carboxylesterase